MFALRATQLLLSDACLPSLYFRNGTSDRQRRITSDRSSQQIKTLKNISSGILIALFLPLETYQNDTHERGNEK
jgi:hypothetical protein